jgi:hypothetical protein
VQAPSENSKTGNTIDQRLLRVHRREEFRHAWCTATNEAALAYRRWCSAAAEGKRDAYAVYMAAADREAAAATAYQRNLEPGRGATAP